MFAHFRRQGTVKYDHLFRYQHDQDLFLVVGQWISGCVSSSCQLYSYFTYAFWNTACWSTSKAGCIALFYGFHLLQKRGTPLRIQHCYDDMNQTPGDDWYPVEKSH